MNNNRDKLGKIVLLKTSIFSPSLHRQPFQTFYLHGFGNKIWYKKSHRNRKEGYGIRYSRSYYPENGINITLGSTWKPCDKQTLLSVSEVSFNISAFYWTFHTKGNVFLRPRFRRRSSWHVRSPDRPWNPNLTNRYVVKLFMVTVRYDNQMMWHVFYRPVDWTMIMRFAILRGPDLGSRRIWQL